MNKIDQYVKQIILNYPSMDADRFSVFMHMFTVLGNGYEWVNGELELWSYGEGLKDLDKCDRKDPDVYMKSLEGRKEQHMLDFIDANIDEIASEKLSGVQEQRMHGDQYILNIHDEGVKCTFFEAPCDELTQEWREALIEWGNVWRRFFFVHNHLSHFDCVKFKYDDGGYMYVDKSTDELREQALNLTTGHLEDIQKYNSITKKMNEVKTPEMIKAEKDKQDMLKKFFSKK